MYESAKNRTLKSELFFMLSLISVGKMASILNDIYVYSPGPVGPTGPSGNTGATGQLGATGSIGGTGANGIRGRPGSPGNVIVSYMVSALPKSTIVYIPLFPTLDVLQERFTLLATCR